MIDRRGIRIATTVEIMSKRTGYPQTKLPYVQKRLLRLISLLVIAFGGSLLLLFAAPTATQPAIAIGSVTVYSDTITIPTYVCNTSNQYNATYGISYTKNDACFNYTEDEIYTRLVLENEYLRLSLLPELGGRVYELIFKPTGHNEFYQNPVIDPTPWGPPEQGGWLAAGGLEWGLPVSEHGYEWGMPWSYTVISSTTGITVTLRDSAPTADRLRAEVTVHLPAGQALFRVTHRLENGRGFPLDFSYWTNAMLAPGAPNAPTEHLRFIIPGSQAKVHSRDPADNFLPAEAGVMGWPHHAGRDMSHLGQWSGWFGFFAYPQSQADFAGVYDPSLDEGVMHVFPKNVVIGTKGFGFGWDSPISSDNWTNDGSSYVELHNGPQPTFWDTTHLEAGDSLVYTDLWYPLSGLGSGITSSTTFVANEKATLALTPTPSGFEVSLFSPAVHSNVRAVMRQLGDETLLDEQTFTQLGPESPQQWSVDLSGLTASTVSLMVFAEDGSTLAAINPAPLSYPYSTFIPLVIKNQQ